VPAESLYVDEVTFPHVHDIIDAVGVSRESLSDRAMESVSILFFLPRLALAGFYDACLLCHAF